MKSFTNGGGKKYHALVRGIKRRPSLVDKSDIGGRPSRRGSAREQSFSEKVLVHKVARKG